MPYTIIRVKQYTPSGFIDSKDSTDTVKKGLLREEVNNGTFQDIVIARPRKHKSSAADTREALEKNFVSEEGSLPWQLDYIWRTGNE